MLSQREAGWDATVRPNVLTVRVMADIDSCMCVYVCMRVCFAAR